MSRQDLSHFKDTLKVNDYFISVIDSLITKLIDMGYISSFNKKKYIKKLSENISELSIGSRDNLDYKTGFYDASQKKLYIKDDLNVPSCYLRLLYTLITSKENNESYITGYSTTKLSSKNYKLVHENFGFNRGVVANLACKLSDLFNYNLSIVTSPKTYTHNFLGYEISASNDIYAIEGKLISEFCFAFNIDEEMLYSGLFSNNPKKFLENIFRKNKFKKQDELILAFDNFSRTYSTYNKLLFLSSKLNDNYLEIKRNILSDDISNLKDEQAKIEARIFEILNSLNVDSTPKDKKEDIELYEEEIKINYSNLLEVIENMEVELKNYIITIQNILADVIISINKQLSSYQYASKLKMFNDILIVKNEKITKKIMETILFKLLPTSEITAMNIIEKIKYSLILNILSEKRYTDISNTFSFRLIPEFVNEDAGTALVLLSANKSFAKLIEVSNLNMPIEEIKDAPKDLVLDNLKYVLNSDYSNMYCTNIERLYTALRNKYEDFSKVSLDDIYIFEYDKKGYMIVYINSTPHLVSYNYNKENFDFKILELSENYLVFSKTKKEDVFIPRSNLPTVYKKNQV